MDSSLALLREGYRFIGNRCRRLQSDVLETRLLGRRTICLLGADAAEVFYDTRRMSRDGAMPGPVKNTLLGKGGVQGLNGSEHRHRKALFMDLMTAPRLQQLAALARDELRRAASGWQARDQVVLLEEVQRVLLVSVCEWSAAPPEPDEVDPRTGHARHDSRQRPGDQPLAGGAGPASCGSLGPGPDPGGARGHLPAARPVPSQPDRHIGKGRMTSGSMHTPLPSNC